MNALRWCTIWVVVYAVLFGLGVFLASKTEWGIALIVVSIFPALGAIHMIDEWEDERY